MSKRLFAAMTALFVLATAALFVYAAPADPAERNLSGDASEPESTPGSTDGDVTAPPASDSNDATTVTETEPVTDPPSDTTPAAPEPEPETSRPDTTARETTQAFTTAPIVRNTESELGYSRLDPRDPSDTVFTNPPETQTPSSESESGPDSDAPVSETDAPATSDTRSSETTAAVTTQKQGASYTSSAVGTALLIGAGCAVLITVGLIVYRKLADKIK